MFNVKNESKYKIYQSLENILKTQVLRRWPAKVFSVNFEYILIFALSFHFFILNMLLSVWIEQLKKLLKVALEKTNIFKKYLQNLW